MYQRDYILRMIEMMGDFIAAVLSKLRKEQFPEASRMIENAYYDFLKQDAAFFRKIPAETLTRELMQNHHFTHGHLEILAELFFAEAELNFQSGNLQESVVYYTKTKTLLEFIQQESGAYSLEMDTRIASIQERISLLGNLK